MARPARRTNSAALLAKADVQEIIDTVRAIAPEFLTAEEKVIKQYIKIFSPLVGRKVFGDKYFLAMALLICHKMKLAGLGSNKYGTVDESLRFSSITVGDESVSFNNATAVSTAADEEYKLTSYGIQFNDIKRRVIIPIHCGGAKA